LWRYCSQDNMFLSFVKKSKWVDFDLSTKKRQQCFCSVFFTLQPLGISMRGAVCYPRCQSKLYLFRGSLDVFFIFTDSLLSACDWDLTQRIRMIMYKRATIVCIYRSQGTFCVCQGCSLVPLAGEMFRVSGKLPWICNGRVSKCCFRNPACPPGIFVLSVLVSSLKTTLR